MENRCPIEDAVNGTVRLGWRADGEPDLTPLVQAAVAVSETMSQVRMEVIPILLYLRLESSWNGCINTRKQEFRPVNRDCASTGCQRAKVRKVV